LRELAERFGISLGVCQEDLAAISSVDNCVPSQRHTGLVPDFAGRLAKALNITFIDCIQEDQRDAAAKDPAKQPATASKILRPAFQIYHNFTPCKIHKLSLQIQLHIHAARRICNELITGRSFQC
jgi:hypothetical protein